jgi:hypothetical protein
MPKFQDTIDQLEDKLGLPIVLLSAIDASTGQQVEFRLRDLPLTGIVAVVAWLNARQSV